MRLLMMRARPRLAVCLLGLLAAGCATRAVDVKPAPADAADFQGW
jgi:hypothetical protein